MKTSTNSFWTLSFTEQAVPAVGIDPVPSATCQNGDVFLGYGSPEFIGLGFSVLVFLVFIEVCDPRLFQHLCLFPRNARLTFLHFLI
jgi:hypothetical protein